MNRQRVYLICLKLSLLFHYALVHLCILVGCVKKSIFFVKKWYKIVKK